jgi:hypothetical protein
MNPHRNLADPEYEPSDEDLAELMREAFRPVHGAREESLRAMRARIEQLEAEARARFEALRCLTPISGEGT